jgi:hypothetical protein
MSVSNLFFRHINPNFVINEVVSNQAFLAKEKIDKQAFIPQTKDKNLLSTYSEKHFNAESAFEHFKEFFPNAKSVGVMAVSTDECDADTLPYHYDNNPFEGHASIDFSLKLSGRNYSR